jgi:hypothetical protein
MVVMSCPWCEDEVRLDLRALADEVHCEACGTWVLLAQEEEEALELAA